MSSQGPNNFAKHSMQGLQCSVIDVRFRYDCNAAKQQNKFAKYLNIKPCIANQPRIY